MSTELLKLGADLSDTEAMPCAGEDAQVYHTEWQ